MLRQYCVQYFGLVLHVCMYSMCINFRYSNYEQPPALCVCVSVCLYACMCVCVCIPTLLGSFPHTVCYAECVVRRGALKGYCSSRWLPSATSSALRQSSKYIGGWSSYSAVCQFVCLSVHTTLVYRRLSACPSSVRLFVHQSPVCLSVCLYAYLPL